MIGRIARYVDRKRYRYGVWRRKNKPRGGEGAEAKLDAAGAAAAPVDDEATLAATAKAMGYGAVKYADLKNNRMTNYK